jgi:hypothetical protein
MQVPGQLPESFQCCRVLPNTQYQWKNLQVWGSQNTSPHYKLSWSGLDTSFQLWDEDEDVLLGRLWVKNICNLVTEETIKA